MEEKTTGLAGHVHSADPDKRKAELLREAEFYRAGVVHARAQIRHGVRPDVILHSAIDHATWALRARADALLRPTGTSVTALAPYALTVFNFIRRRRLGKPALGVALLLGGLGWYMQHRRAQQELAY
jgi:hypothetical protein